MLSKGFKIVSPKRFEVDVEQINLEKDKSIVKVDNACICKADLRYYLGNRDARILGLKYPMRLIHEAVGTVLKTTDDNIKVGNRVVLVPNVVSNCNTCTQEFCNDESLGENYCPYAKFASSNQDGFSAEVVNHPTGSLVLIPDEVPSNLAVFSELISVAVSVTRRVDIKPKQTLGVWGDGLVGYILAVVLKKLYPENRIVIVGRNSDKIEKFPVDLRYDSCDDRSIKQVGIDIAFECVGGEASTIAINQIIDCIKIGGKIVLAGVAENNILMNTRKILEKGIMITGSTRSTNKDFEKAIEMLKDESFSKSIEMLIIEEKKISNIVDYYNAFEEECVNRKLGKCVLDFHI